MQAAPGDTEMARRAASLAAQAASTVESSFNLAGGLPKGAIRRALDRDIASEGGKVVGDVGKQTVILSDGSQVPYEKPQERLRIPDWSQIESIKHYFGSRGYQPYPAWLFHPNGDQVLVKDAKEAVDYGIVYRKTTDDERMRYGRTETWDWEEGSAWRPHPLKAPKLNFADHAGSKNLITAAPNAHQVQSDLVAAVAASVAQVLKLSPGAAAPASVDAGQWEEFLQFQAWKKANEVVAAEIHSPADDAAEQVSDANALVGELTPEQDRILWEAEADRLGIKHDKRMKIETLRAKVEEKMSAEN